MRTDVMDDKSLGLAEVLGDVRKLGLEEHITELDTLGYTVVPPDKVAPPDFQRRVLDAILEVHERRTGERLDDLENGAIANGKMGHFGLLFEGRIFEEVVLNPTVLTLARYLTGQSTLLSDMLGLIKSQHDTPTHDLHTDSPGIPSPLPPYAQVCNVTWIHTDYSRELGSVALVPGSHKLGRHPEPYEENWYRDDALVKPIAVDAPAGSIICWHGNTWHGAWPRVAPGVRINTLMYFCRSYVKQMQDQRHLVTDEMLERNPPEFAELLGRKHPYPFANNQFAPDEQIEWFRRSGRSQWS